MLAKAKSLARQGRTVYVIACDCREQSRLRDMIGRETKGIKVECPGSVDNFDFRTMTLRGSHPNCVVLVDHYTIEQRFHNLLEMLFRFD